MASAPCRKEINKGMVEGEAGERWKPAKTPPARGLIGVADGARTHDNRSHSPGLYLLSYGHH